MTQQVRELFGVQLAALSRAQAVQRCLDAVARNEHLEVAVVNAAKIVHMRSDPVLNAAVTNCPVILADGQSVVWASRMLRRRLPERVTGIDLFDDLLAAAARDGIPVYFLGAREEVLSSAVAQACRRHPGLLVVGRHHGYFSDEAAGSIADGVRESGAKMLFLGMTSPKKETFCAEYGIRTGATVVHGVGGSFDILAGGVRRAPRLWQRLGMEWLFRLLQEPVRMGPRYFRTNTVFIYLMLIKILSLSGRRPARGPLGPAAESRVPTAQPVAADRLIILPDTDLAARLRSAGRSEDPGLARSRGPDRAPSPLPSDALS